jgi:hypothetical protein
LHEVFLCARNQSATQGKKEERMKEGERERRKDAERERDR